MTRLAALLLAGVLVDYVGGLVTGADSSPVAQSVQSEAPGDADLPPPIPPVPNPPLYPDAPNRPMHWTASEIAELYDRRLAWIRAGGTPRDPRDGPPFAGQFFRTHLLTVLGRTTFDPPRPSNIIGVMSRYDDADLHEEVSDFYVMAGGAGEIRAGGQIVNATTLVDHGQQIPGELRGPAITGGEVFEVGPGDWVSIPANTPAQVTTNIDGGLTYMVMKVNAMLYPWELIR